MIRDRTNRETSARAKTWVKERTSPGFVIVLARSKAGLANEGTAEDEEAQAYAEDNGLLFMETSARTALNVNNPFLEMAKKLPQSEPQNPGGAAD